MATGFEEKLKKRRLINRLLRRFSHVLSLSVFGLFSLIFLMLFLEAFPLLRESGPLNVLLGKEWLPSSSKFGLYSFITGSLVTTFLALAIAVPVSVLTAILLSEYMPRKMAYYAKLVFDVLSGVSPVVYGFWAVMVVVPFVRNTVQPFFREKTGWSLLTSDNGSGFSVLSAGMVLAIMASPLIVSISEEVLRAIPSEIRQATMSLGSTKWEMIRKVLVRKAGPGIIAAIILSLSRTIGETMAVLMVAGCQMNKTPASIFDPAYPLPALIANTFGETMSIPMYKSAIFLAAFILLFLTFVSNLFGWSILLKIEEERA